MKRYSSIHHIFNFDLRHFAGDAQQWWSINSSNWPIGAALKGRQANVTQIHIIGGRDERVGPLRVHRGTFTGSYGADISVSLLRMVSGLGTEDVIFLHEAAWPAGQLVAELCPSVPLVGAYHGKGSGNNLTRVRQVDMHLVLRQEVTQELVALGVPSEKIVEVTPSVSGAFTNARWVPSPPDDVVLGFIGRPYTPKGIDDAVAAARALSARGTPTTLELIGASPSEDQEAIGQVRRELQDSGVHLRVLGRVSNEELPFIMARWRLLAFPSREEGCPRSVLEAAALGIPTVGIQGVIPAKIVDGRAVVAVPREEFTQAVLDTVSANYRADPPDFVLSHEVGAKRLDAVLDRLQPQISQKAVEWRAVANASIDAVIASRPQRRVKNRLKRLKNRQ